MLNVAIAVDSATDYGPQAVHVVAAACQEVIGEQRCPVASELEPGTVAAWYAVVHPNDRGLSSVRIEFRDRTADGVLIEQRSLAFSPRDSLKSRLASVGSVIAALAAAREGSLTRPLRRESAAEPSQPPASPSSPTAAPEAPRPDWGVDVAGLVAPTFGDGPYRVGGLARAQLVLFGRPFALVAARYAAHPGNPSFSWWTLSAGVGTRVGDRASSFNLEFRGELVFEHTSITAESGADHQSAQQSGWGGRVGVDAVWASWRHCSIIFGVDGTVVLPRINVIVGDADEIRVPVATAGLLLGLRFQP
jgi:hypothetical protein